MKKVLKFLGVATSAAVFTLSLSACGENGTETTTPESTEDQYYSNLAEGLYASALENATISFTYEGTSFKIVMSGATKETDGSGLPTLYETATLYMDDANIGEMTIAYKDDIAYVKLDMKESLGAIIEAKESMAYQKASTTVGYMEMLEEMGLSSASSYEYAKKAAEMALGATANANGNMYKVELKKFFENLKAEVKDGVTTYTIDYDALKTNIHNAVTEMFAFTQKDINGMLLEITDNQVSAEVLAADIVALKDKNVNDGLAYLKEKSGYSLSELITKVNDYVKNDLASEAKAALTAEDYESVKEYLENFDANTYALEGIKYLGIETGDATTLEGFIKDNYGEVTASDALEMACEASEMTVDELCGQLKRAIVDLGGKVDVTDPTDAFALLGNLVTTVADEKPFDRLYAIGLSGMLDEMTGVEVSQILPVFGKNYSEFCTNLTALADAFALDLTEDFSLTCKVNADGTPLSLSYDFDVDLKDYIDEIADLYNKSLSDEDEKVTRDDYDEVPTIKASISMDYTATSTFNYDEFISNFSDSGITDAALLQLLSDGTGVAVSDMKSSHEDGAFVVNLSYGGSDYEAVFGGFEALSMNYNGTTTNSAFLLCSYTITDSTGEVTMKVDTIELTAVTNTDGTVTYKLPSAR